MAGFIPPPQGPAIQQMLTYLSGSYTFDLAGATATIEWILLAMEMDMTSTMQQDFTFCPHIWNTLDFPTALDYYVTTPSNATIETGTASSITFEAMNDLHVKYPCFGWPYMDVGISHQFTNDFTNHTWDSISFDFSLTALWFHINIPFKVLPETEIPQFCLNIPGQDISGDLLTEQYCSPEILNEAVLLNTDKEKDFDYEFGPLVDFTIPIGYIPFTWYDNTWNLEGFLEDTVFPGTQLVPTDTMSISISGNDVLCYGDTSGNVQVNIVNGMPPFTFTWSNGQTQTSYSNTAQITVPSGVYFVTVTDANDCSLVEQLTIVDLNPEIILNMSATDVLCTGENTGSVTVSATGGTPGYTYLWVPSGATTSTVSNLYAGIYTVTVTDAIGCSRSDSVPVNEPTAALSTTISGTNVSCFGGSNGTISLTVSGGTPGYTYLWNNGSVTEDLNNIPAGDYSVTVTDANGCTTNTGITITDPAQLIATVSGTDVACYGETNGACDLSVTGGVIPYLYQWDNGAITEDISGLTSGTFVVTVTDANGCTDIASMTITEPSQPLSVNLTATDVLCYGDFSGEVDIIVSGGTPDYTYLWSNGATSDELVLIPAGNYSITVTDAHQCTTSDTIQVNQPQGPLASNIIPTHVLCHGYPSGTINLTVTGGTPMYHYLWNTGHTTQDLNAVTAGQYIVFITDANNCTLTDTVIITEPPQLMASISGTNILCYGENTGAANLTASGGVPPYIYIWSTGQTTEDISNLTYGFYSVVITDANNCTASASVYLTQPLQPLSGSVIPHDVLCKYGNTGSIDAGVTGGMPGYDYVWSNGSTGQDVANLFAGVYSVTISDYNSCTIVFSVTINEPVQALTGIIAGTDIICHGEYSGSINLMVSGGTPAYSYLWSNGSHFEDLNQLPAGNYQVTITDANQCTVTGSAIINEPDELAVGAINAVYICRGDTALVYVSATGGVPGYTFYWDNGMTGSPIAVTPVATTYYVVYAVDASGCTSDPASAYVYVYTAITATMQQQTFDICPGDAVVVQITVNGGNGNYIYYLQTPDTVVTYQTNPFTIHTLESGNYTVLVKDDCNSPQGTVQFSVITHEIPDIIFSADTTQGCPPLLIRFNEQSPPSGQTYEWHFGDVSGINTSTLQNPVHIYNEPGIYDVSLTVTSEFGCSQIFVYNGLITIYALPDVSFTADHNSVTLIDPEVNFENNSHNGGISHWDFGDGSEAIIHSPSHSYSSLGEFTVTLTETNIHSCSDSAFMKILVYGDITFYVPTAFSPDDDGLNDEFKVFSTGVPPENFSMLIYNRWGEKIFESKDINLAWNGRDHKNRQCKNGVYTWLITYDNELGVQVTKAGAVTIIR
ncbi:MAG: gliding motility-associated C-terminal domain-containing protein [Bacteroidia bacterium]|nr:gliding motility-associated C-terminal domain-containing protein [Bacteroidia bacterium]